MLFCTTASRFGLVLGASLVLIPLSGSAESYLSDPAYCDEPIAAAYEAGVMALYPTGTETIEYGCTWETPISFDWSETSTQIRPGYCAEPGEYIYPQVFVFGMSDFDPGVVLMWSSEVQTGEAARFVACD
jgi:hypothetical protein